ncbi:hypothetical protein F5X99DRAFT_346503 [Biscogniauxia marginata]|nr:hypothetical protein F5X99DRAFT_346503 [Biscogniauxia marginata]
MASDLLRRMDDLSLSHREDQLALLKSIREDVGSQEVEFRQLCDDLENRKLSSVRNPRAAAKCLKLLSNLYNLSRALDDLIRFRNVLDGCKADFDILLVPTGSDKKKAAEIAKSLDTEIKKLKKQQPKLPRRLKSYPEKLESHCEMQLLVHLESLSIRQKEEIWGLMGCSRRPCFCCYYMIKHTYAFQIEPSHGKVYYPWPVPLGRAEDSRIPRALDGLLATLENGL